MLIFILFLFPALPPPLRNPSLKSILETLNALAAEDRSAKFLLKDEFLHQYGLLHSSRSSQPHEVSDSPSKTADAPLSVEDPTPKETATETSLVKCPTLTDVAGPSSKLALAPIIEEEENPRITEKSADVEAEKENSAGHHDDDTFDGLSDIMITSRELFKDDITKVTSPVTEATSTLQQTLPAQESTPVSQSAITPQPKSGL